MSDERIMTQAEAEAGTSTEKLATTPERQKQAIAALGGGGGLATKSGVVTAATFSGNPKKATVTFSSAFADANYSVAITGGDADTITYESKIAASFDINLNTNPAPIVDVVWVAIKHGET